MSVLGQFRIVGAPERFVWLRGFTDMAARLSALHAFYDGPIWGQYRDGANALIADSDHVHLLRPLGDVGGLTGLPAPERIAAELSAGSDARETGLIVIDFYQIDPAALESVPCELAQAYRQAGLLVRGVCAAELAENDFPRLPVIQNPGEFVIICAYPDEADYHPGRVPGLPPALGAKSHDTLRLRPTLRSPLRW